MLDAYIIDSIRREEERERAREASRRIFLELPKPEIRRPEMDAPRINSYDWIPNDPEDADRGPIVIPLYPDEPTEDAA